MNFTTLSKSEVLGQYKTALAYPDVDYNNKLTALIDLTGSTPREFKRFIKGSGIYYRESRRIGNYNYNKALLNILALLDGIEIQDAHGKTQNIKTADIESYIRDMLRINKKMTADGFGFEGVDIND